MNNPERTNTSLPRPARPLTHRQLMQRAQGVLPFDPPLPPIDNPSARLARKAAREETREERVLDDVRTAGKIIAAGCQHSSVAAYHQAAADLTAALTAPDAIETNEGKEWWRLVRAARRVIAAWPRRIPSDAEAQEMRETARERAIEAALKESVTAALAEHVAAALIGPVRSGDRDGFDLLAARHGIWGEALDEVWAALRRRLGIPL